MFIPQKEVYLVTVSSPYDIRVQLCNKDSNGKMKTVACASTLLLQAERQYSQFEKESLALISVVKKYHEYL